MSDDVQNHKQSLLKLKTKDPDFYQFLQDNDADLLNFGVSDDDELSLSSSSKPSEERKVRKVKAGKLLVSSLGRKKKRRETVEGDVNDVDKKKGLEDVFEADKFVVVSLRSVKEWDEKLQEQPKKDVLDCVVGAFKAAVSHMGGDVEQGMYTVEDSNVFNAVVRLCFTTLLQVWKDVLKLYKEVEGGKKPKKNKIRGRYSQTLKSYLSDLLLFLPELQDDTALKATVTQLDELACAYAWYPKLAKNALKVLIKVWCKKPLQCRRVAFSAVMKLARTNDVLLERAVKTCYLSYVNGTKLVVEESWPVLEMMRESFAQLCLVNEELCYRYAFLYIRQMAIHLRNAMISKKKDLVQTVYNWQFVQCLYLWAMVLKTVPDDSPLAQLRYPLIQVTIGVCRYA